jgi:SP family myo-inositol transporter-like MFS transporter 13
MYYSATIFALVNFKNPTATALLIALTNFLFTLIAFGVIDRIGRRRVLLLSIPFMSIGLFLSSFAFTRVTVNPPSPSTLPSRAANTDPPWGPALLVSSLLLFVAAYALGLGNVPWHQSELFPLNVRALGSSLATATNWTCNALVGLTFLPILESLGAPAAVGFYAVVCLGVWAAVWRVYPERMGVGLEEVRETDEVSATRRDDD